MFKKTGYLVISCLILVAAMFTVAAAQGDGSPGVSIDTSYVRNVEVGLEGGSYNNGLRRSNAQFVRLSAWRPSSHTWRADVGRSERFGEKSYGLGVSYTRHLPTATDLTLGVSSGTGDFLAPEYRIDFGVQQAILPQRNLFITGAYTRVQSKEENSSDGFTIGSLFYKGHWLFGADYHYDIGHPGDTISRSWQVGATWYIYKRTYIGATYKDGDVSYMIVGPGNAIADYDSESWTLGISQWFWLESGINLKYSHETTSFYKLDTVMASFFKVF